MTVLGVDWARRGWVAVALDGAPTPLVLFAGELAGLIEQVPDAACIGVDMPIGVPQRGVRAADVQARAFVKSRRASVFMTPPAEVLRAADYTAANVVAARLLGGSKISQQAWSLRHNIEHVAALADRDERIVEMHPEVSFAALEGEMRFAKTTWNGQMARRAALARAGIALPDDLGDAGGVPPADILDAAAVAWSARRYADGTAQPLPPGAPRSERQVIWY